MKRVLVGAWRVVAGFRTPSKRRSLRRLRARGETLESIRIREATAADIPELAALHVKTWNDTYAPLLLKGPGHAVRERQWREKFHAQDAAWFCYVVERQDGRLVGFAQGNRSDHPEFAGELNKIYLLRDYQRLGVGTLLLGHVARRFRSLGINSMWLFGDARNPASRAWTRLGALKIDDDPGTGNYGWRDLTALAAMPDGSTPRRARATSQRTPAVTGKDVARIAAREFPADSASVLAILGEYGVEEWHREVDRVRVAALKLAAGDLDRLRSAIETAKQDYRDVLAHAEYPQYLRSVDPSETVAPDDKKRIRDADWKQYSEWLGGEGRPGGE
jgi:GNAT superfamily N-acetyltransferase